MHMTKRELYDMVKDLISKEDFEREIQKKYLEFEKLLNEDAIAYLIVDSLGKNIVKVNKISELQQLKEATLFAKVTSVNAIREFTRKNGSMGRVANLEISDNDNSCKLVLWDTNHIELVENDSIKTGSKLKIVNARVKNSMYGIEISIGQDGNLITEPEDFPKEFSKIPTMKFTNFSDIKSNQNINVSGTILEKSATRIFTRKDGGEGIVSDMTIFDGTGNAKVVLWGEKSKFSELFKVGDNIEITGCIVKERNGNLEIQSTNNTEISKKE